MLTQFQNQVALQIMTDNDKENQQSTGSKIQVVLAIIALVSTLGVAIISNWDKVISKPAASSTSASQSSISQKSGSFEVLAKAEEGVPFTNPLDKPTMIRVQADGYWSANPGWKDNGTSPEGYNVNFGGDVLCRDARGSSLVMKNSVGDCSYIGKDKTINLAPKETVRFYINDVKGNYDDNQGIVKVKWSIEDS